MTPVSKLEVKGKTTLNQQSDDAALEISGAIKVFGTNPAAMIVTAQEEYSIVIDNPICNNNPDAMILVTSRCGPGIPIFHGSVRVNYDQDIQKWTIVPTGWKYNGYFQEIEATDCNGICLTYPNVASGTVNVVSDGQQFNVLIIDK